METKGLDSLRGNPENPRTMTTTQFQALKDSLDKFGDLSGIVKNLTTGQLVGGHQRVERFKRDEKKATIQITFTYEQPTRVGTRAVGYVNVDGELFAYREVEWPLEMEQAANIAANNISGQWDNDALAKMTYEIQQANEELLNFTGQRQKDIKKLMQRIGVVEDDPPKEESEETNELAVRVTVEQSELISTAIEHVRITHDIPSTDGATMNGAALYYMAQHYLATNPPLPPAEQRGFDPIQ